MFSLVPHALRIPFGARQALRALTGLAFGLRVHVEVRPCQRAIFAGAENLSVQQLTAELAEMISSLRVYSYAVRGQLLRNGRNSGSASAATNC